MLKLLKTSRVHQMKYRRAREALKALKTDYNPLRLRIAIDQQTLPWPSLAIGPACHKQKLWAFNFVITNLKPIKTTLYIWDGTSGGKSSVEVANSVLKWLETNLGRQCIVGGTPTIFQITERGKIRTCRWC